MKIGSVLLDRYEILRVIGRGGMGVVYLARDSFLEREVAIKVLSSSQEDAKAEERLRREALAVAKLDHPAIVGVYDIGHHEGSPFFVMPFVPGQDLHVLMQEGSLRLGEALEITAQVAEALNHSHQRHVIHRDIKPANIIVERDEAGAPRPRITDFGVARLMENERTTKAGSVVGTIAYLSPEQARGADVDGRSDVYSLATVLYELIVGQAPFTGKPFVVLYNIINEKPVAPSSFEVDIDPELEKLILDCLEKDPAQRPSTALEFAKALTGIRARLEDVDRDKLMSLGHADDPRQLTSLPPLVGRDDEFEQIKKALNAAESGEGQLVTIGGDAGVGKTRLLEEAERVASARGITVLHGRFLGEDEAFPFHGFLDVIVGYFRQRSQVSGADVLSDLAPDLLALFPALGEIDEMRPISCSDSVAPRVLGHDPTHIFDVLAKSMIRIGGGKPLVILFEDLHAGSISLEALQYVVRRLGATPTLVVGTFLSTELDGCPSLKVFLRSFEGDRRSTAVVLKPLGPTDHRTMLEELIGSPDLDDDLVAHLYEVTEGNPCFTRELVHSLIDTGSITGEKTGYVLSGNISLSTRKLPATIQQAVERRFARLPEEYQDLLSAASVFGKNFDLEELENLELPDFDIDDALDRLVADGFLEEARQQDGDIFCFSSTIVRDVLYDALPRRRRRSLHRRCGEVVESMHEDRLDRVYPRLVHHFSHGRVSSKAIDYGLKLARMKLDVLSGEDALNAARAVLDLVEGSSEQDDRINEARSRMIIGEALTLTGDLEKGLEELVRASELFAVSGMEEARLDVLVLAADTAWKTRKVGDAGRLVKEGLEIARAIEQSEALATLLGLGATLANLRGEHQKAEDYHQEALRLRPVEEEEEVPDGGTLVVGLPESIEARHPAEARFTEEEEVLVNVFETLLTKDDQGVLVPHLCSDWEAMQGGRIFQLTLRSGIRLHDGCLLTAHLVKISFESAIRRSSTHLCPAFAAIRGVEDFIEGTAEQVVGLEALTQSLLQVELAESMPIYPALLTDTACSIVSEDAASGLAGTGPFKLVELEKDRALVERNTDYWRGAAKVDRIEFRAALSAEALAAGFRSGETDVVWGLRPDDLNLVLRDPKFRKGLFEAPRRTAFFVLFNVFSNLGGSAAVRQALGGVIDAPDLVRRSVGRLGKPTEGFLPPGVLGHDPGRRQRVMTVTQAKEILEDAGIKNLRLRAAVHPIFLDRYISLTEAILDTWSQLGVDVAIRTSTMDEYLAQSSGDPGVDLYLIRWTADYDDPDSFFFGLFHSARGLFSGACSSEEMDRRVEEARVEKDPAARVELYRSLEKQLLDSAAVLPLFHEIASCVVSPAVKGLELHTHPPYVSYERVGKIRTTEPASRPSGGTIRVPMAVTLESLDPAVFLEDQWQIMPTIFETLTRQAKGARIVPWLAAEIRSEADGLEFYVRLRPNIRFHDGRRLRSHDVRASFERLLRDRESSARWMLAPIRGARGMLDGSVEELSGLRILSATEFVITLETPLYFFPALLTSVAIVPEGVRNLDTNWRGGCLGTGPFRVRAFDPGRYLELEPSPFYWLDGYPRCDALIFDFGLSTEEIVSGFRGGRYSLAWGLSPAAMDTLLTDTELAPTFRQIPRLSTYFLALNSHRGPLQDIVRRRQLVDALDVADIVRRCLGRYGLPATTLTPPDLLDFDPIPRRRTGPSGSDDPGRPALKVMILSVFSGPFRDFALELFDRLTARGFEVEVLRERHDNPETLISTDVDLVLSRWIADYPDADSFFHGVLHSVQGDVGPLCSHPEVDRLIEKARGAVDPGLRSDIHREIETVIDREALLLPLFHEQECRIARPEVQAFELRQADPVVPYENLWIRW